MREQGHLPLNYRSFHSHIQSLQSHGMISTSIVRTRKGRTKEIELLVEKTTVEEEVERREKCVKAKRAEKTILDFVSS